MALKMIGLIRVSTPGQAEEDRGGIPSQEAAINAIVKQHGGELVCPIVVLPGVHGDMVIQTQEWKTLVEPALKQGVHIVCDRIDRLLRASNSDFTIYQRIQESKAKIYTTGQVFDSTVSSDRLLYQILSALGGYQKSEIVRTAQMAKESLRKQGQWVSGAHFLPTGISYDRKSKTWGYTPDIDKVKFCFQELVAGTPILQIAAATGFSHAGVSRLAQNTIYKGIVSYSIKWDGKRKYHRDEQDVIRVRVFEPDNQAVTDEVWALANQKVHERASGKRRKLSATHDLAPFTGLLVVEQQRTELETFTPSQTYEAAKAPKHVLYARQNHPGTKYAEWVYSCRCRNNGGMAKCTMPAIPLEVVNRTLLGFLTYTTMNRTNALLELADQYGQQTTQAEAEKRIIENQIKTLNSKLSRVTSIYVDGEIEKVDYQQRKAAITKELTRLTERLAILAGEATQAEVADQIRAMAQAWQFDPKWSPAKIREWVMRYVTFILVNKDGIEGLGVKLPGTTHSYIQADARCPWLPTPTPQP